MSTTISNQILGCPVVWNSSVEEPDAIRWETQIELPNRLLDINVITAVGEDHRKRILEVSRWVRRLAARFDQNIEEILDWYMENHGVMTRARFRSQLRTNNNFFVDFTESPVRPMLEFYDTDLQHLGVPIGSNGNIIYRSG